MLGLGLTAIEESAVFAPIIVYFTILATNHTLTQFINQLMGATGILDAFSSLINDPAYSLGLTVLIVSIVVAVILIGIVGGGFVLSAEYGTYLDAWSQTSVSIGEVLENGRRGWKRTAWTLLLTDIVTWSPAIVGVAIFLLFAPRPAPGVISPSDVFLILTYEVIAGIFIIASLILSIFTIYSVPASVIDQVSGPSAIARSFHFVAKNFRVTFTYILVRLIFQALSFFLLLYASSIGLPLSSLGTVVLSLLLTPILHSTKAMIYSYGRPSEAEMPFELFDPIWHDIGRRLPRVAWRKVRLGLSEIGRFLASPRNLPFHILAALAFALGIWLGEYVSANGLLPLFNVQPGMINPIVASSFGPALGIDIFANNWLVSISTGMAGIGFGLPAFQTILFNGFIVGAIIPALDLTHLLSLILPHGVIEIPSLVLSGSIGLKLGWAALNSKLNPSPENKEFLSLTLRQTVYVVIGLAPLFLIAGIIEGNITPIIMRWFGWTG